MKKVNWTVVVLVVFLFVILGLVGTVVTAFYGNPVTGLIATSQIRSYVKENYQDMDLEVTRASYNFKFKDYISRVQSTTSMDTGFWVSWHKGRIEDRYELDVVGRYNTYQRLQRELSAITEETMQREFPYTTSMVFADAVKSLDDYSALSLDMPLDTMTLPISTSLVIYFYQDKINYEVFCERLKEIYEIMMRNKIRIDYYSVVMEEAPKEGEKPGINRDGIYLYDYPASKLTSETLSEDVQKYVAEWELENVK